MTEPLALTLEAAAEALSVSPRTARRLLDPGELQRVRIGRAVRVSTSSLRAYVDGDAAQRDNSGRAGPDVQEEGTCRSASSNGTRTGSIAVLTPQTGGRRTPTRAERELDAIHQPGTPSRVARAGGAGALDHTRGGGPLDWRSRA